MVITIFFSVFLKERSPKELFYVEHYFQKLNIKLY